MPDVRNKEGPTKKSMMNEEGYDRHAITDVATQSCTSHRSRNIRITATLVIRRSMTEQTLTTVKRRVKIVV